jgi:hypothetical protein
MNAAHGHRVAGIRERRFFVSYSALAHAPAAELRTLASALAENFRCGATDAAAGRLYVRVLAELVRRGSGPEPA